MRANFLYIALILAFGSLLFGCQTAVRFTSERSTETKSRKNNTATINSVSKTKNENKQLNSNIDSSGTYIADNSGYNKTRLLVEAEKWIGVPYKWGGRDTSGTDCSGFVQSVYKAFGLSLPRTASDQYDFSELINEEEAEPGDLIFFKIDERIVHVGLFAGHNKMIHASTKSGVIIQELSKYSYYSKKANIAGFGRIVTN